MNPQVSEDMNCADHGQTSYFTFSRFHFKNLINNVKMQRFHLAYKNVQKVTDTAF